MKTNAHAGGRLLATADLAPAPSFSDTGRGLEADVDPLWVGVRDYQDEQDPTRRVREFRDPAQLTPEYLALWGRLAAAEGHPVHRDGRLVLLDANAPEEGAAHPADPEGAVVFPHARYQVGQLGDSYRMVPGEHGTEVPRFRLTVTSPATRRRILGTDGGPRRDQVSPGFLRYVVDGAGSWTAPDGSVHPYDREQVVNPADPRVPPELRDHVGPNYLGVAFDPRTSWTRGRGAARITLDGAFPDPTPQATPGAQTMDLEQALAKIAELEKLLAEYRAKADAEAKAQADAKTAADAKAASDAAAAKTVADGELAKLRAEVDGLRAEVKPHREQARRAEVERVASVASVDAEELAKAADPDLRVAAMKMRLAAGVDGQPSDPADAADPAYLRARFDMLRPATTGEQTTPATTSTREASPEFRRALAGADGPIAPAKKRDRTVALLP